MKVIFYLNSPTYYCWLQYVLVLQLLLQRSTHVFLWAVMPITVTKINTHVPLHPPTYYCYNGTHMCSSDLSYQLLLQRSTHMFLWTLLPITATIAHTCVICEIITLWLSSFLDTSSPSPQLRLMVLHHL